MLAPYLFPFLITALLVELTPGPNMAWLALLSADRGRKAGLAATAGVALGLSVISAASALGVAELAQASPILFGLLRYGGTAFLVWLAWEAWRGAKEVGPEHMGMAINIAPHFRRGLVINLLNPKAALFFIAILPTFVEPAYPVGSQIIQLSAAYVLLATFIHLVIVGLAGTGHDWLQKDGRIIRARRIFALLLLLVAIWFLFKTAS